MMTKSADHTLSIPPYWEWIKISEIAYVELGKTPAKNNYTQNGQYKIVKFRDIDYSGICWSHSKDGFVDDQFTKNLKELANDDVLITSSAHSSEHIGKKLAFVNAIPSQFKKVYFVGELLCIRSKRNVLNSKFIFFYFLSRNGYLAIQKKVKGVHLTGGEARKIEIPLPPLPEQHRIVDKIEELFSDLDDGIAFLKKAQEQLKVYRQAVLKWAFEGKLTAQWREEQKRQGKLESAETLLEQIKAEREQRYQQELAQWKADVKAWEANGKVGKKPGKPKEIKDIEPITTEEILNLPSIPEDWCWVKFGKLISEGPQNGLYKSSNFYGYGTLIVRVDNFYDGRLDDYKTFKRLKLDDEDLKTYQLNEGDILINRVNSMTHIGKCALVENLPETCVFESNIMRLKIAPSLESKFIVYYLSSMMGLKQLRKNSKQAVNQASINQKDIALSFVPICNQEEQKQLVEEIESRLSICDSLETTITENLQQAEALRQSILKQAFEGKLVPQDPNDEPASVLLERIRQTRNKQGQLNLKNL